MPREGRWALFLQRILQMMKSLLLPSQEGSIFYGQVLKIGESFSCDSICYSFSKTCSFFWCDATTSSFNGNPLWLELHKKEGIIYTFKKQNISRNVDKKVWRMCITWPIMSMWCVFIFPSSPHQSPFLKSHTNWFFLLLETKPLYLEDLQFEYVE
jgi:hypothetical protein